MIRKIIQIDTEKCNGCGLCAQACHEGAIGMVDGKARLLRDDYCDGLGDCLPACPVDAISFTVREAAAYDEAAVLENKKSRLSAPVVDWEQESEKAGGTSVSQLRQWPVQIKLVPPNAPYFQNASLLVAADCTAYAYAEFHRDFIRGRVVLVGCPKLDMTDYSEKLTEIFRRNEIRNVTVVRMEVPCCGGIELAVKKALQASGKSLSCQVVTISTDGKISY